MGNVNGCVIRKRYGLMVIDEVGFFLLVWEGVGVGVVGGGLEVGSRSKLFLGFVVFKVGGRK